MDVRGEEQFPNTFCLVSHSLCILSGPLFASVCTFLLSFLSLVVNVTSTDIIIYFHFVLLIRQYLFILVYIRQLYELYVFLFFHMRGTFV